MLKKATFQISAMLLVLTEASTLLLPRITAGISLVLLVAKPLNRNVQAILNYVKGFKSAGLHLQDEG